MRNPDGKALPPPNNLVVQHKEQVMLNNPNTGIYQLSRDYRNVYYIMPVLIVYDRSFPHLLLFSIVVLNEAICKIWTSTQRLHC